ncbi:MAG: IclR family transcriptional regulator [candidate division NC10 bacterium]|nr:IclR family transcriptional regulator [candidate division NC10 bacterium]
MRRIVGRSRATIAVSNGSPRTASRLRDTEAEPGGVQSVVRALTLLEALADQHGDIGIAELSRRVGLHVSTAHRILGTLVSRGYARQSPESGRYALGAKTFHIAESYLGQMDLRRLVRPVLERLSRETGETANLVILDGRDALYLDKVESPRSLRIFSRIGRRAPLYCTAVGKVLLADLPMDEVNSLLGGGALDALTHATVTSRNQLREELRKVQEQGFALDIEECEDGASCIAVPVRNSRGETVAAIGISGPSSRMNAQRIAELVPAVMRSGSEASEQLGFHGRPSSLPTS